MKRGRRQLYNVYFDPSYRPDYFYPLVKPLALVYDQIIIWSPVEDLLEEKALFPLGDFLQACTPKEDEPPAFVPAGRARWFDPTWRRSHPDPARRYSDPAFEQQLALEANRAGTILEPHYETGYTIADKIWDANRHRVEEVVRGLQADLPESSSAVIERVAEEQRKPLGWAVVNSYVQDIVAMRSLGNPPPLIRREQAQGYLLVTQVEARPPRNSIVVQQDLPHLPPGGRAEEIREFLDVAYHASNLPWAEIIRLRRRTRAHRQWLCEVLEQGRRPLREIANIRAHALYQRASEQAGAILGIAPPLKPLIQALSAFGFRARLTRFFAKHLGGKDSILVDTSFFRDAELQRAGEG